MNKDIVEQTCINVIKAKGGIVEGLDDEASKIDPLLLSLPDTCCAVSEMLWLCNTQEGPEFVKAQRVLPLIQSALRSKHTTLLPQTNLRQYFVPQAS